MDGKYRIQTAAYYKSYIWRLQKDDQFVQDFQWVQLPWSCGFDHENLLGAGERSILLIQYLIHYKRRI